MGRGGDPPHFTFVVRDSPPGRTQRRGRAPSPAIASPEAGMGRVPIPPHLRLLARASSGLGRRSRLRRQIDEPLSMVVVTELRTYRHPPTADRHENGPSYRTKELS